MAIKIDKSVTLGVRNWSAIGQQAIKLIRFDAGQGVFQQDKGIQHKKDYSTDYARLKERRFTYATKKRFKMNEGGMEYAGMGKERVRISDGKKGQRMAAYKGIAIASTNTSFVDMTVTGQTLRGLKIRAVDENSVTLGYEPKDAMKILGNARPPYNRVLVGLNDKNHNKIANLIFDIISERLIRDLGGDEIISLDI